MNKNKQPPKTQKSKRMVEHVLKLLRSMPAGGLAFDDFFDDGEIDSRTIQRDLADLKKIADKMDLDFKSPGPGRGKGKYYLGVPIFEADSSKSIFIHNLILDRLENKPWAKMPGQSEEQNYILYQLMQYRRMDEYNKKMRERVVFMEPELRNNEEITAKLSICLDALEKEQVLKIVYKERKGTPSGNVSKQKEKARRIRPLGLICKEERWYLLAFCCQAWAERMFRLDRMNSINTTGEQFTYPQDFSLKEHLEHAWSTHLDKNNDLIAIRLLATGMAAEDLENITFHPSQKLKKQEEGYLLVSFELETWEGMLGWILRWGSLVEVLEPEDLRQKLKSIAKDVLGKYQSSASSYSVKGN